MRIPHGYAGHTCRWCRQCARRAPLGGPVLSVDGTRRRVSVRRTKAGRRPHKGTCGDTGPGGPATWPRPARPAIFPSPSNAAPSPAMVTHRDEGGAHPDSLPKPSLVGPRPTGQEGDRRHTVHSKPARHGTRSAVGRRLSAFGRIVAPCEQIRVGVRAYCGAHASFRVCA